MEFYSQIRLQGLGIYDWIRQDRGIERSLCHSNDNWDCVLVADHGVET